MKRLSSCGRRIGLLALAIALVASPRPVAGQARRASEYELKATFIYNLIRFVDWPEDVLPTASDALRLVIIGHDRFNGALDRLLADKTVDHRSIVVVHAASGVTAPAANIVFLAASEEQRLASVLAAYCHAPVLTVSDIDNFAGRGGVIGLVWRTRSCGSRSIERPPRRPACASARRCFTSPFRCSRRSVRAGRKRRYISQIRTPSPGAISIESNDGLSRIASRVRSTCIFDCDQSIPCSAAGEMTTDLPPIQLLVSTTR
jgi:hypothetical protein